jgi:hypothetical protein
MKLNSVSTAVKSQRSAAKMNHFRRPAHRLSFFYFAGCLLAGWLTGKVALTQRRQPALSFFSATISRISSSDDA